MRCSSAGGIVNKLRPTSKDLIQRSLSLGCHNTTTPIMDDSENDLTLTPDQVYRLGTPLKPLEEETTISTPLMTTPPSSLSHSVSRSIGSTSSSPTLATPTSSTTPTVPHPVVDNSSLLLELDAFSKVMNQVEQKEKAKERRASQPRVLDSAPHLMSPPPYSMTTVGTMPRPPPSKHQYTTSLQNCYTASRNMYPPPVYDQHPQGTGIHGNQDYTGPTSTPMHLQLQHPAPPTSHSQLGALLQSPTCTQSSSFEVAPPPIDYSSYPNSISSAPVHSPYPLWDSQGGGMGGVTRGMSQSFEPQPRAGQKRAISSLTSMYLPQTKVAHSTISHMPPHPDPTHDPLQNFQTQHSNGVSSFPQHGNTAGGYSHIS